MIRLPPVERNDDDNWIKRKENPRHIVVKRDCELMTEDQRVACRSLSKWEIKKHEPRIVINALHVLHV